MGPLAATPLVQGHFAINHLPWDVRWDAASAAGFVGVSGEFNELRQLFGTMGEAAVLAELERRSLRMDHLELVLLPGPPGAEGRARDEAYCVMARTIGARGLHAVALDRDAPYQAVVEAFGALAEAAARHDLLCGLEFVPKISAVEGLDDALKMLAAVSRSNARLVLDSFHFFRCGAPWDLLEGLPEGSVMTVQVNDGDLPARTEDYYWEASSGRLLPGDGDFDLVRFMVAAERARTPGPVSLEVMSDALDQKNPLEVARATLAAARAIGA